MEQYLLNTLSAEERLFFEARLLTEPALKSNLAAQTKTMELLKHYHLVKLHERLNKRFDNIMNEPKNISLKVQIKQLFKLV